MDPIPANAKKTAVDSVVQQITHWILSGKYRCGERLPAEARLAELTGVSRSSVREALRQMSARGMVSILHGSGTYVESIKSAAASQQQTIQHQLSACDFSPATFLEFRVTIEQSIARLALENACADDLTRLEEKNIQLREAFEEKRSPHEQFQLDMQFHHILGECTRNVLISVLYDNLMQFMYDEIHLLYEKDSARGIISYLSHQRIWEALAHKDLVTLQNAVTESSLIHIRMQGNSQKKAR